MLAIGELVICVAILVFAIICLAFVTVKDAARQNTSVKNLILSMLKFKNSPAIGKKAEKAPAREAANHVMENGKKRGRLTMTKNTTMDTEATPGPDKKSHSLLVEIATSTLLFSPGKLFGGRKDKFEEQSKQIDNQLNQLLAENVLEGVHDDLQAGGEKARMQEDAPRKSKEDNALEPAPYKKETPEPAFKVEKLEFKEGMKPKWDAYVTPKDPAAARPEIPGADMPVGPGARDMKLNINDRPVWGHTDLGKPLADFKSPRDGAAMPAAMPEGAPAAAPGAAAPEPSVDEVKRMLAQANSRLPPSMPSLDGPRAAPNLSMPEIDLPPPRPAFTSEPMKPAAPSQPMPPELDLPAPRPAFASEPIKPAMPAAAPPKPKEMSMPSGMDFGGDLLKELQEEEEAAKDDGSLAIMHEMKDQKFEANDLEFDAIDVLSMITQNVKNSKPAKASANKQKSRPKP